MPVVRLFGEAWFDFTRAWPQLLLTDIVYKLVAFVLLTPLVGLALGAFLSLAGQSVVADQDILLFVLSPIGMATVVVVATATLAIAAVDQAALLIIAFGATRGTRVPVREALWVAARRSRAILEIAARLVVRILLLAAPFLAAAGAVYALLLTELDINFYLSERPPAFWVAGLLIASILFGLLGIVGHELAGWAYALPMHLFEDVAAGRALTESAARTRGHRGEVLSVLVAWAGLTGVLSAVLLGAVTALGRFLVPRAQGSMGLVLFVMGSVLLLWLVVNLLVTLLQGTSLALLVVRLYDGHAGSNERRLPAEARETLTADPRKGFAWKPALSGLLVASVLAGALGVYLVRTVRTDDDVLVIAHRGAAGRAPENTLASFEAAMDDGADLVELDVQETKDGSVVVIHDSDFMKIAREPVKVWEGDLEELRALDIGSWFSSDFSSERLPTLEETLALARGRGSRLDIELKDYRHNERLEERVVELVEAADMAPRVVVMSLNAEMVAKVRALRPGWTVGLLTAKAVGDLTRSDVDFLAVHLGMVTRSFVRRAHRAGKDVYVWTVNDPVNLSRMMSRGVDGVITDEPALARAVLAERAELGSIQRLVLEASYLLGVDAKEPPPENDAS